MIYKLNLSTVLLKLFLIGMAFNGLFYFTTKDFDFIVYIVSFVIIVGLEVLIFFLKPFLYKIVILENSICFYYKKFLINNHFKEVNQEDLSFSYKPEKGARGSEAEELRFYINGKKITGIGRGLDGWNKENVTNIIKKLENLNINKLE
ncbi:hypothetical protein [Flavobacterium sp. SORGH_AS_0622]|uniref:hypothetical protein n=1 Tax=Flavobacterium sp. SORGH_AS_0622 TaxID=3041772 RepID=UPI002787B9DA|nr:hypothetical protein [Flavobacterium sp. SORGH_AS_0622]MDQ1166041.1 hypothetical protein [Flavobacterium sp. SORGH_AS_0622]